MTQFHYRAARPDGTVVEDWAEGDGESAVRTHVAGRGWLLLELTSRSRHPASPQAPAGLRSPLLPWSRARLSPREFLVFNQEFLALLKAGLPVLKLFDLLAERAGRPDFKQALLGLRHQIRGGASISDAMAHYPGYFSELYRASLHAGEQTGNLPEVLQRFLDYQKLVMAVRDKVTKAMAYPAFLIGAGVLVVAFLLAYVMPTFSEIYGQNHAALPGPTRLLLEAVDRLKAGFVWLIGGLAGLAVLLHRWTQRPSGRLRLDRLTLSLPLVGNVILKSQISRMARTLSTSLASGMPLLTALHLAGGALTNRVLAGALAQAAERVKAGAGLAASLQEARVFPPVTLEMIEVGETTGSLETMLKDVAEFHEGELDLRLSQVTTWIEPALLLIMGILVGGIVIVMYLPIFQIAGTV